MLLHIPQVLAPQEVAAMRQALDQADWTDGRETVGVQGAQVKRKEDPRLITGTSTYTGDISLPGLHYVAFVRSPHAHARIRRIDASAVLKRPGVIAVVTGADLKPHCGPVPVDQASTEVGAVNGSSTVPAISAAAK